MLGYNYIQNPIVRHIRKLLDERIIGDVNHVRIEMDEDFMADPAAPFQPRHEASNGWGAIEDFGVHPLSLIRTWFGGVAQVMCDMAKPYPTRVGRRAAPGRGLRHRHHPDAARERRLRFHRAQPHRLGPQGRIAVQIIGAKGAILYDQERFNEFQLYLTEDRATEQGFRTILSSPQHAPYGRFVPVPGHGLGFNDLKAIECRELVRLLQGEPAVAITFEDGIKIERTVAAMAKSFETGRWWGEVKARAFSTAK